MDYNQNRSDAIFSYVQIDKDLTTHPKFIISYQNTFEAHPWCFYSFV